MTSYAGTELLDEVFEWAGDEGGGGGPVGGTGAADSGLGTAAGGGQLGREAPVDGPGYSITTDPVDAIRAFEVFMGRRYDPSEKRLGSWVTTGTDDSAVLETQVAVRPSIDVARIMTLSSAIEAHHGRGATAPVSRDGAGGGGLARMETPLQRYARLLSETAALESDLAEVERRDAAAGCGPGRVDPNAGIWKGLRCGVSSLSTRLAGLESGVTAASVTALPTSLDDDPSGLAATVAPSPLVAVLESLRAMASSLTGEGSGGGEDGGRGTHLSGGTRGGAVGGGPSSHAATVELDARVAALEVMLGLAGGMESGGVGATPPTTAFHARLAAVEDALKTLTPTAAAAVARSGREAVEAVEGGVSDRFVTQPRVVAAVAALERCDAIMATLPHVTARLATLQQAHDAARLVPTRLAALEHAVGVVDATLTGDAAVLRELKVGVADLAKQVASWAERASGGGTAMA